jgi:O-antigen ligase
VGGAAALRGVSRLGLALLALVLALAGLGLGSQHPVAPWLVSTLLCGAALLVVRQPTSWLFWFPTLLPLLHFSPWTGWWLLDESDLAMLAILAGGYARWAWDTHPSRAAVAGAWPGWRSPGGLGWLCLALVLTGGVGVWRGLHEAGGLGVSSIAALFDGMYAGYDSPWNTLRVAKSLLWALLLLPLLRHRPARPAASGGLLLARGMVAGLFLTCLVVLMERHLYAGVLDFTRTYRTSAWFWEMHVGGGAIDAYLALAAPFAFWAVWTAPRGWRWWAALGLLCLTVYVVLTTYSRGIYLAALISLAWMAFAAWRWRLPAVAGAVWRLRALVAVALVLLLESAVVLGGGAFMGERLAQANHDLAGRLTHWRAGLSLVQTPADGWLGIGWGRLPARYSQDVPGGEFPGQARWESDPVHGRHVRLSGPASRGELGAHFALTQRVALQTGGVYTALLRLEPDAPVRLLLSLCARHLLYSEQCQGRLVHTQDMAADAGGALRVVLEGPPFDARHGLGGSLRGIWSVSVVDAGRSLQLTGVALLAPDGTQVLHNGAFTERLQRWTPAARSHFHPWHIDNLYLETLIERGAFGLVLLAVCAALVAWALLQRVRQADALAWVFLASLLGLGSLGVVISVLEVPRVAVLGFLLLLAPLLAHGPGRHG